MGATLKVQDCLQEKGEIGNRIFVLAVASKSNRISREDVTAIAEASMNKFGKFSVLSFIFDVLVAISCTDLFPSLPAAWPPLLLSVLRQG
jgi:hypothetical protein